MARASKPVVLITGISSGIGLAAGKKFASEGWIVVGTVRGQRQTAALRVQQFDLQPAEMARQLDLSRVVNTTWKTYGRIDAVLLNAGTGLVGPIDSLSYAQMSEQLSVNVLAPAEILRTVIPYMRRQGSGTIIGVSGYFGMTGMPGFSMHAASKFGLRGLLESLWVELAEYGIRVKMIEVPEANTPFWARLKRGTARRWKDGEVKYRLGADPGISNHGWAPEQVAKEVYRATADHKSRFRYTHGRAKLLIIIRHLLPESLYRAVIDRTMM